MPTRVRGVDMFSSLVSVVAHFLSWMFVIGMVGCVLLVIPIAAYQLFSVLFERDRPEDLDPSQHPRAAR